MINGLSRLESGAIVGKVVPSTDRTLSSKVSLRRVTITLLRKANIWERESAVRLVQISFLMIYQAEWRVLPTD